MKKIFSTFTLKIIAVISMIIDHMGYIFFPNALFLRCIGRLAFPLFVFILVQGFFHTSNIKYYLLRLLGFCFLSEFAFDFAFMEIDEYLFYQNVFFTLFFGMCMLYLIKRFSKNLFIQPIIILAFAYLAHFLRTDYGAGGILLIAIFYYCVNYPLIMAGAFVIISLIFYSTIELYGVIAIIPIMLYNGEKGKSLKYLFYIIYPAHLLLFGLIDHFIIGA